MYKTERIFTISETLKKKGKYTMKYTSLIIKGEWLHDLGYTTKKRILVKTIKKDNEFQFNISLLD